MNQSEESSEINAHTTSGQLHQQSITSAVHSWSITTASTLPTGQSLLTATAHLFPHPHEDAVVLVRLQRVPELDGEGVGLVGQRGEHLVTAGRIVINMGGHSIPTAQQYHYHCGNSPFRGMMDFNCHVLLIKWCLHRLRKVLVKY